MTALFLTIGTALAFHHLGGGGSYAVDDARQVFPLFALHELPSPLRGLVFAGLFAAGMSSLDYFASGDHVARRTAAARNR